MSNEDSGIDSNAPNEKSFWDRHAKLSIILIAGVFYFMLIGMCAVVGIIIWQS